MFTQRRQIISAILLSISALGVTFSGPLILGWIPGSETFWDFGSPWKELGAYLDIIGGLLELAWIVIMINRGLFKEEADPNSMRQAYKIMAGLCLIGVIADPLGGLLALSAQLGLYTSLYNLYSLRVTE